MPYDRFLVSNFNTGLQQDLKPWLIMDDAWEELNNVYAFRGRVIKRVGSRYMGTGSGSQQAQWTLSRLRVQVGTTNGSGNLSGTVPVFTSGAIGMAFSIGTELYYVYHTAGGAQPMYDTGSTTTKTYNNTNGAFVFAGAPISTAVYYYPNLPVMGLAQYEIGPINNYPTFGFDTSFAYQYTNGWSRSTTGTTPQWFGGDLNFFDVCNWEDLVSDDQILFVTNYQITNPNGLGVVTDDPIWFYAGSTAGWRPLSYSPNATINPSNLQPLTITRTSSSMGGNTGDTVTNYVQSARIIVAFKNRLLLIGTIENNANGYVAAPFAVTPANYLTSTNSQYVNRCRYSHLGTPVAGSSIATGTGPNAWLEPNYVYYDGTNTWKADGAGYIDASTDEQAISAEFIKDRLIVYFERSTWEIAYTGSDIQPFLWQRINTELGSQSQFSSVPFDTEILTIGQTGVHACSGANVQRIDARIPDYIFTILENNQAPQRIWGIRDFQAELVYWNVPKEGQNDSGYPYSSFPSQILVYNYRNNSWALWDDSITAFGYYQQQTDQTWGNAFYSWESASWSWNSGAQQAAYRAVMAGNTEGFTFVMNNDVNTNESVLQITNLVNTSLGLWTVTIINHNLFNDDYITLDNCNGITATQYIYRVLSVTNANTFTIADPNITITGTYTGGGTASRVSQISMLSKQFNPYVDQDRDLHIYKINFQVLNCGAPSDVAVPLQGITVDYYPSYSELSITNQAVPGVLTGTNVLDTYYYTPLEATQERFWHPVYFATDGEAVQLNFYMTNAQMTSKFCSLADFELHGMLLYTRPTRDRLT